MLPPNTFNLFQLRKHLPEIMSNADTNYEALKNLMVTIDPEQAVGALQSLFISYVQRTEYCQLPKSERANIVFTYVVMHEFFMNLRLPEKAPLPV